FPLINASPNTNHYRIVGTKRLMSSDPRFWLRARPRPQDVWRTRSRPYRPVPKNVLHLVNFYQQNGFGKKVVAGPDFKGELSNVDLTADTGLSHTTIEKSPREARASDPRRA
ncbi:MAG: hypothetical protein WBE14_06295, partial [Xanthobacteraceae bacterium]